MENDFCNKCGECCKHIKVNFEKELLYFDGIQQLDEEFKNMLIETEKHDEISCCECKFLVNNQCKNPEKPDICRNFPSSPFAFIPENCGYTGKVFMENEMLKQKIRKYKEEIIHYNACISSTNSNKEKQQFEKLILSRQQFIDRYKKYDADNW